MHGRGLVEQDVHVDRQRLSALRFARTNFCVAEAAASTADADVRKTDTAVE